MWLWTSLERFWQDMRFAARTLRKNRGFTFVAALSLALGIGANTAMFSLVDGVWTRPMAVSRPDEIVRVFSVTNQNPEDAFSYPEYLELQSQATAFNSAFNGLIARGGRGAQMPNSDGTAELRTVNVVTLNFFSVLGVRPLAGRLFTPQDEPLLKQQPAVVLGNSFWQQRFGGDPSIIGKSIELQRGRDRVQFSVLGVLPETFREIENGGDRDLWLPPQSWVRLSTPRDFEERAFRWFRVLGRIAPGASVPAATAQLQTVARRMAADWPQTNAGRSARALSDRSYRLERAGANAMLFLAVVLLLVLLCSVNVANLLLAKGAARAREVAIRLSLGAPRGRLVRQLMTENLLLGLTGLAAGLGIGAGLITLIPSLLVQPPALKGVINFQLDFRVFSFSLAVSALTIGLFGLLPAWTTSRTSLVPGLKGETALLPASGRSLRPRHWLVVSQIGLSLALLASTGVLVESFVNTRTLDYGLARKPLLLVWLISSGPRTPALYREAVDRLREFPGVKEVAFASRAPLSLSEGGMAQRVTFPDHPATANQPPIEIKFNSISSNYLHLIGTALRRGRLFDETDQTTGPPAALINESMAQRYWPTEDAIGKTIQLEATPGAIYRIVGIVQNAPINAIGELPEPYLYLPYWRNPTASMTFVLDAGNNAPALSRPLRQKLIAVSPLLDPFMITTQEDLIRFSAGQYQMTAELVSSLGFMGLLLTAVGLYGVVSYGVNQRQREIGIRMALGAQHRDTVRLVLREVIVVGIVGIALGLPLALLATHLGSALLFGVAAWDPTTFLAAVALLTIVLLAAGALPARRATRVNPMVVLRSE